MGIYDEKIKKANREIEKLLADIEKKKARIEELRNAKKQYEAERTRDATFSDSFLKLLVEGGIKSDEQRNAVLAHIEDFIIAQEIEKDDKTTSYKNEDSVVTENLVTTHNSETSPTSISSNQQNPAYPHKP